MSKEGKTDNAVMSPSDSSDTSELASDDPSGNASEFGRDDTGGTRDTETRSDFGGQSSSDAVSFADGSNALHLADVTAASTLSAQGGQPAPVGVSTPLDIADPESVDGKCNEGELQVHVEVAKGSTTPRLNERSDERLTVESEHWNGNGSGQKKCDEDQVIQNTSLCSTKRGSSGRDIQNSSTSKRTKTPHHRAMSIDMLPIDDAASNNRSGHAPHKPVPSETATKAQDVEPAARKMLSKVAQHSDLVPFITGPDWQVWLRGLLGRQFEEEILTRVENMISAESSKGKFTNAQFGADVVWVAKQLSPDKAVLPTVWRCSAVLLLCSWTEFRSFLFLCRIRMPLLKVSSPPPPVTARIPTKSRKA
jgi:hypothetical protein